MKKLLALLLIAAMILSAVPVLAAESPAVEVSTVDASAGETVNVTISLKNNPGITSIKFHVAYDQNLTLNSVTYNSAIGGMSMQPQQLSSPVTLNWFNGLNDTNGDWVFATLSFTVAETAAAGEYAISVTYDADNVFNIAEENITFAVTNGAVKVACNHANKTEIPAKKADCLNAGNNKYYTCSCGKVLKADGVTETTVEAELIAALGHDFGNATCTEAKTCKREGCGHSEGTALGHSWAAATCTSAKTCKTCGATEGTALGHDWVAATCTSPKTCKACGVTEGTTTDHSWVNATCTAPKTCANCGITEGAALGHTESGWKYDKDNHWKICDNAGCGIEIENSKSVHADADADGKCDTCGYQIPAAEQENPKTGDQNILICMALMLVSAAAVVLMSTGKKKYSV